MLKKTLVVIAFLALASVYPVYAAEQGQIELTSVAEVDVKAVSPLGVVETKRMDVGKAKVVPGDVVIYTTVYRHIGKDQADKVVINNPVPEHTLYVDKSAEGKGARIEFSADGGKTYAQAKILKTAAKGGKPRPAVAADYTHVRWTLDKPLKPGAKGSVSFRAKLK